MRKSLAEFDTKIDEAVESLTVLQSEAEVLTKEVKNYNNTIGDREKNANDIHSLEQIMNKVQTKVKNFE